MIQDTLNAATGENVQQLEDALKVIWDENNLTVPLLDNAQREGTVVTIDIIGNKEILSIAHSPCIYGLYSVSWICCSVNKHFQKILATQECQSYGITL